MFRGHGKRGSVGEVARLPEDLEQLFRTFLDNGPLFGFIVDEDDRLTYSSEPVSLGDEHVGASMWDLVPAEYVEPYRQAVVRTRQTQTTQVVVWRGLRFADGRDYRSGERRPG